MIRPSYLYAEDFSDGLALVQTDPSFLTVINTKNEIVFSKKNFESYSKFSNELLNVSENGKYGYLNQLGNIEIPFYYDNAQSFHNDVAAVQIGDHWGLIDKNGNFVIDPQFKYIMPFDNTSELSSASDANSSWYLIGRDGKRYTDNNYRRAYPQCEGFIVAQFKDGLFGVLDRELKTIWKKDLDDIDGQVVDGTIAACSGGKWGVLNVVGDWDLEPTYTNLSVIRESRRLAYVGGRRDLDYALIGGLFGYLDAKNRVVIPPNFQMASNFFDGVAKVQIKGTINQPEHGSEDWGYIDNSGVLIWSTLE